jgi:hypothetical protein
VSINSTDNVVNLTIDASSRNTLREYVLYDIKIHTALLKNIPRMPWSSEIQINNLNITNGISVIQPLLPLSVIIRFTFPSFRTVILQ